MDYSFYLSDETIEALKSDDEDIDKEATLADGIMEVFGEREYLDQLDSMLRPYLRDKIRGELYLDNLKVEGADTTLNDDYTGTVYFCFDEEAYYGCDDLNKWHDHQELIRFAIDMESERITFHAMDEQVRDTVEEF